MRGIRAPEKKSGAIVNRPVSVLWYAFLEGEGNKTLGRECTRIHANKAGLVCYLACM